MANLPSNFQQVSSSFSYTVLDFRLPWETAHSNEVTQQQQSTGFPSTPVGISKDSNSGPPGASQFFSLDSAQMSGEPTQRPTSQAGDVTKGRRAKSCSRDHLPVNIRCNFSFRSRVGMGSAREASAS